MPLTAQQQQMFRAAIEKRRAALLAELRLDATQLRDESFSALAGEVRDRGDESVADLIVDSDRAALSRDLAELRELEAALESLDAGRYGTCADCGVEVGVARLEANPAALRCAACQARHEKLFADARGAKL